MQTRSMIPGLNLIYIRARIQRYSACCSRINCISQDFKQDIPWCFNRKETKDHGEGGNIVGSPLENRVLVIDDVITAGTAIRETMEIIAASGASAAGVVVAMDRQEKGKSELSAIQEIEKEFSIPVISIINLQQIINYLEQKNDSVLEEYLDSMKEYQSKYGI